MHVEKFIKVCKDILVSEVCISDLLQNLTTLYDKKLEGLYFYKEHSYNALMLLEDELKHAGNEIAVNILKLQIAICKFEIHNKEMQIQLLKAKIYDIIHDTDNWCKILCSVIKERVLSCRYISRLKDMLAVMLHIQKCAELSDGNASSVHKIEFVKYQSLFLLYSLQTYFLQCDLHARLDYEEFPKVIKKRLSNLIANYNKFHLEYYCNTTLPQYNFGVDQQLFSEICAVNFLFKKSTIECFDWIMVSCATINCKTSLSLSM